MMNGARQLPRNPYICHALSQKDVGQLVAVHSERRRLSVIAQTWPREQHSTRKREAVGRGRETMNNGEAQPRVVLKRSAPQLIYACRQPQMIYRNGSRAFRGVARA